MTEMCTPALFSAWTYQILAGFWDCTDIHWLPFYGIDEASFSHSYGTDDMDPPGDIAREKFRTLIRWYQESFPGNRKSLHFKQEGHRVFLIDSFV